MGLSSVHRRETQEDRLAAVVRAISLMRAGLGESLSLSALARIGLFSPFHFHRVFREVTGVTPARFLAALRMAEAKRMLLHSSLPVVNISSMVGYDSPGTFCTQFTRLVGVAPGRFRQLVRAFAGESVYALLAAVPPQPGAGEAQAPPAGDPLVALSGASDADAVVVGGIFPVGSVSEPPATWVVADGSAPVRAATVPEADEYRACTVVIDPRARLVDALVDQAPGSYLSGVARIRLAPGTDRQKSIRVPLRTPQPTDPPLLAATPLRWLADRVPGRPAASGPSAAQRTPTRRPAARRAGSSARPSNVADQAARGLGRTVTVALAA